MRRKGRRAPKVPLYQRQWKRKYYWSCAVLAEEHEDNAKMMVAECATGILQGIIYEDIGKTSYHKGESVARARYLTQSLHVKVTAIKMFIDYSDPDKPLLKPSSPCLVRSYENHKNQLLKENKQ